MKDTKQSGLWKVISASSVGTLIEWYDFYIFGSLSAILAGQFFPKENPTAGFLATLATFAAGFVVRPFGALVFGRLGDRVGRKYTFLVTLVLMGGSTFAIGLIPGYSSIGIFAPLLVLILRLVQGLAIGGEYGGAATYVAEHAPAERRGFFTSFIQTTASLGLFVSLGAILAVRQSVGVDEFASWGWRIPFLLSALLVGVSIYIRLQMKESPLFTKIKDDGKLAKNPIRESFGNWANLKMVLIALFGVTAGQGVVFYTSQFYALTFIQKICGVEFVQSNTIIVIALLVSAPAFVFFGWLSDRIGRKAIMMTGLLLAVILYRPIYKKMYDLTDLKLKNELEDQKSISRTTTMSDKGDTIRVSKVSHYFSDRNILVETTKQVSPPVKNAKLPDPEIKNELTLETTTFGWMVLLLIAQVLFVAMVYGPIAAFLVELFPTRIRYTSMSLPYHIGNGVFGGLTPFLATWLFESSKSGTSPGGDPLAGLWYPIVVAAISFVAGMILLRNRKAVPVD